MKTLIAAVILVVVAWGVYVLVGNRDTLPNNPPVTEQGNTSQENPQTNSATSTVKEFGVVGNNFSFSPSNIKVKRGDTVRIVFQSQGGNHDWVIDEFAARTRVLNSGQSETIEFVADESGSFEYYCSVGTHRQMGMKGTLVVE